MGCLQTEGRRASWSITDIVLWPPRVNKTRVQHLIKRGVKAGLNCSLFLTSGQLPSKSEGDREKALFAPGASACCCCCLGAKLCPTPLWPQGLQPTRLFYSWDFPARILEWVATSFSRGSSRPRDRICGPCGSCTDRQFLYHWAAWEVQMYNGIVLSYKKGMKYCHSPHECTYHTK